MTDHSIIKVIAPGQLLQTIRASHAVSEAGYTIALTKADEVRYTALADAFPETLHVSSGEGREVEIEIDHKAPRTSVGSVSRPLIFPIAMVDQCRRFWQQERDVYCLFRGLMTPRRKTVVTTARQLLNQWPEWLSFLPTRSQFKVVFADSKKGRMFPEKSWDPSFYAELGGSRFALCPNGDYIWTYRFFEAALCGAIPIVEQTADCYHGFRYYTLEELTPDLEWSEDKALHNFELCRSLVTVPRETLRAAVNQIITRGTSTMIDA